MIAYGTGKALEQAKAVLAGKPLPAKANGRAVPTAAQSVKPKQKKPEKPVNVMLPIGQEPADLATVEQQIEQRAQNVDRIQRDAVFEIGRELDEAQQLHRYREGDDGFVRWMARRLPHIPQRSAYQAIEIYRGLGEGLFANFANMKPSALAETAKADPDVKAIIAERVEAGEIFTAAKVKELKQQAAAEAVERINAEAEAAKRELAALRSELETKGQRTAEENAALRASVADLTSKLAGYETEVARFKKSLPKPEQAKEQAAENGGVVLGTDGKFHSGSSAEQKRMHDAFMFAFDKALDLTESPPSPERVVAGCPAGDRARLAELCTSAMAYLDAVKGLLNGQ